ncbi:MAG: hypothetical protein M1826_005258 [Phylliscum demangeonii]|nr:MAG: hypothetical protein M1826_005258 [Phylliscum demangeonii]
MPPGPGIKGVSGSSEGSSHSDYGSASPGPLMQNTRHKGAGGGTEATFLTSFPTHRLPQPFFCLGELMRMELSGEETYTGFIVALSLVDQSVWVVFNARDSEGRWTTAHESPDDWDDDRDDVPDYLPDLDPAWAELVVPGEKWAAAMVARSLDLLKCLLIHAKEFKDCLLLIPVDAESQAVSKVVEKFRKEVESRICQADGLDDGQMSLASPLELTFQSLVAQAQEDVLATGGRDGPQLLVNLSGRQTRRYWNGRYNGGEISLRRKEREQFGASFMNLMN